MPLKISHEWTCDLCGEGIEHFVGAEGPEVQSINDVGIAVVSPRHLPTCWSYVAGKFICSRHKIVAEINTTELTVLAKGSRVDQPPTG